MSNRTFVCCILIEIFFSTMLSGSDYDGREQYEIPANPFGYVQQSSVHDPKFTYFSHGATWTTTSRRPHSMPGIGTLPNRPWTVSSPKANCHLARNTCSDKKNAYIFPISVNDYSVWPTHRSLEKSSTSASLNQVTCGLGSPITLHGMMYGAP